MRSFLFKVLLVLFIFGINTEGFGQKFEWGKSFGGSDWDFGKSICVDTFGNSYITGQFHGTADFDPGIGTFFMTSNGTHNCFITKLDSLGNFVWAKNFGALGIDQGTSIVTNNLGEIYVTGIFAETVDFDPGIGVYNLSVTGLTDIFILKLDILGNFLWVKQLGGTNREISYDLKIDDNENIYISGSFKGVTDFDPGVGVYNLTSNGGYDIFILKLNVLGNLLWVKQIGSSSEDIGSSITVSSIGDVYTSGWFRGTVDFDPSIGIFNMTVSGLFDDAFIVKLNNTGNFLWAKQIGGTGTTTTQVNDIEINMNNEVLITGFHNGTTDFDPNLGIFNISTNGGRDAFISKYDTSGSFLWTRQLGGLSDEEGNSISIDSNNDIYTIGRFHGTVDFNTGTGSFNLIANLQNIYIHKLNDLGDFLWARQIEDGSSFDDGLSIFVDDQGYIYSTGRFQGTLDLNIGTGNANVTTIGTYDVFVQKLAPCIPINTTDARMACDAFQWIDGNSYTSNNTTAKDTLITILGCDSIVTLNLTIINSTTSIDVHSACDSLIWINGNTYTSSNNTTTDTLTNSVGCDSIITLNLTILNSTSSTDVQTACDSYTWIDGNTYTLNNNIAKDTLINSVGCDSIVTLNLTILNSSSGTDIQTACDTYTWTDGITYTTSNNIAKDTLVNSVGCDSVVTLNLTILNSSSSIDIQTACDTYTWIDGITYTTSNNITKDTLVNAVGCDSVVTLNLTLENTIALTDVKTSCNSYTWIDGDIYSANNNTATFTLIGSASCDTILTLDLTIENSTIGIDNQNATSPFTWINGITYTTDNNTATTVLVNSVGCDSLITLNLTMIDTTVNIEAISQSSFSIFPNPTNKFFTIHNATTNESFTVEVYNILGEQVFSKSTKKSSLNIDLEKMQMSKGTYFIKLSSEKGSFVSKVVYR